MAKIVWAVFCQSAIIDGMSNNLSIINQYDKLHPPTPPPGVADKKGVAVMAFPCALASLWERDDHDISETIPMRVRLIGPGKRSLPIAAGSIDLSKSPRSRFITNMPGLPIVGAGTYTFVYEIQMGARWKRVGDVSFQVTYQKASRDEKQVKH